jgi:hypothetical protein
VRLGDLGEPDGRRDRLLRGPQTLKSLERDGLVSRAVYATVPPRVEYALTDLGVDIGSLADAVGEWAVTHAPEITAARDRYDQRTSQPPAPVLAIYGSHAGS